MNPKSKKAPEVTSLEDQLFAEDAFSGMNEEDAINALVASREESSSKDETTEADEPSAIKPKYSQQELLEVFDSIMFEGSYVENLIVKKDRISATFRTRTAQESNYVLAAIDRQQFSTLATLHNHQILMTLSYALQAYTVVRSNGVRKDVDFSGKSPKDVYVAISALPESVIEAFSRSLGEFDNKVRLAMVEGNEAF